MTLSKYSWADRLNRNRLLDFADVLYSIEPLIFPKIIGQTALTAKKTYYVKIFPFHN